jgi:hypothetical protein
MESQKAINLNKRGLLWVSLLIKSILSS